MQQMFNTTILIQQVLQAIIKVVMVRIIRIDQVPVLRIEEDQMILVMEIKVLSYYHHPQMIEAQLKNYFPTTVIDYQ